jgi:hypothetical protein
MPWLLILPGIAGKALDFLKSPIGIIAIVALAYLGGSWQGRRAADARCEARAQASIEAAAEIDRKAAREALQSMERQKEAAVAASNASQEQFERYKNELATRAPDAGCMLSDPDLPHLERVPNPATGPQQVAPLPPKRHR